MVQVVPRSRLLVLLRTLAWLGCLYGLDIALRHVLGADYFRRLGLFGMATAVCLATLPDNIAARKRERNRRAEAHEAFMARHYERMARRS